MFFRKGERISGCFALGCIKRKVQTVMESPVRCCCRLIVVEKEKKRREIESEKSTKIMLLLDFLCMAFVEGPGDVVL